MRKLIWVAALALMALTSAALAEGKKIGVAWGDLAQPRWRWDVTAMRSIIERSGNKYIPVDAGGSAAKQLQDIEKMIVDGVDAIVIQAVDKDVIMTAVERAAERGIPMLAYDRLIEHPGVFYITFDNVGVGRIIAAIVKQAQPTGNYAIIKGDPGDPNSDFLRKGMEEVIGASVAGGQIRIVGEEYADGWRPDAAKAIMERILAENGNQVDAVLAENDNMAGAAIEALQAAGLTVPIGGQDGDPAALNRVAQGMQTVSVWKNSFDLARQAGRIAVQLAEGTPMSLIPEARQFTGGEKGIPVWSILLNPTPITADTLDVVIDADHVTKKDVCRNALPSVAACR
ncbi:substrate-binding domain-containing protein [Rhodobacter calidifons]|uniref:Substrate-binding domain-containing protein n=1 Tax=Rhodobacter calidifons TaxID=2715277 RepID=A0ABX0G5Q2_9RHOB|nr:substrate-binding domain-containing protein [Rhodobacter calidifons]NHB76592.1 substrate-binding domain-containing protein [Rhodobacter calidifons]